MKLLTTQILLTFFAGAIFAQGGGAPGPSPDPIRPGIAVFQDSSYLATVINILGDGRGTVSVEVLPGSEEEESDAPGSSAAPPATVDMVLNPAASLIRPGVDFTVNVEVLADGTAVDGAEVHLIFDPAVIEVVSLAPGAALPSQLIAPVFDNTLGTIDYAAGSFSGHPAANFILLTIHFRALAASSGSGFEFSLTFPRQTEVASRGASVIGSTPGGSVVVDDEAPVITRLDADLLILAIGDIFDDPGATAIDNIDGDLTAAIVTGGGPVDTAAPGTFTITYDVSDRAGNAALQVTRTVKVVDGSAVSRPVGYHTLFVKSSPTQSLFNFFGANFTKKVLAAGVITGEGANTITDAAADFTTSLGGASNLFVQITSATGGGVVTAVGANAEVTGNTMTNLTTIDDLSGVSEPGDSYIVREAMTIADIFGPNNEIGLAAEGVRVKPDIIWIPDALGGFDQIFYNATNNPVFGVTPGWKKVGAGSVDHSNDPVYFTEGFFIERKTTPDLEIVVAGCVDTGEAVMPILSGFNYLDRRYPVGATLGNSNIYGVDLDGDGAFNSPGESGPLPIGSLPEADFIDPEGAGAAGFDVVLMQNPDRSDYDQFFFATDGTPGWKKSGAGDTDFSAEPLREGFIVERITDPFNLTLKADADVNSVVNPFLTISSFQYFYNPAHDVEIGFDTNLGFDYIVQTSTDLVNWMNLITIPGDGLPADFFHAGDEADAKRFYRFVRMKRDG